VDLLKFYSSIAILFGGNSRRRSLIVKFSLALLMALAFWYSCCRNHRCRYYCLLLLLSFSNAIVMAVSLLTSPLWVPLWLPFWLRCDLGFLS
jgi:hypothetical protein